MVSPGGGDYFSACMPAKGGVVLCSCGVLRNLDEVIDVLKGGVKLCRDSVLRVYRGAARWRASSPIPTAFGFRPRGCPTAPATRPTDSATG